MIPDAMKRLPWRSILASLAALLVLAGVTPLVYVFWWGYAHTSESLSVPLSLKRGEYISPLFTTDLNDDYQIDIYFLSPNRTPLDLDWKTVDNAGALIQSGGYREDERTSGGNVAILDRHYRPKRRSHQRIILNLHRDVQQASESDTRLHIGVPERSLALTYGFAAALMWLVILAGLGVSILVVLATLRVLRRPSRVAA